MTDAPDQPAPAETHPYNRACRNTQHPGCACMHPVDGKWCGKARHDPVHADRPAPAQAPMSGERVCADCEHPSHGDDRCRVDFEEHGGLRVCECEPVQRYSTPSTSHGQARHCVICGSWCWPDSTDPDWPAGMEHAASCPVGEAERLTTEIALRDTAIAVLRDELIAERSRNAPLRARIKEATIRADRAQKEAEHAAWENWSRLFRPLNEAMATERKLEAVTAALQAAERREAGLRCLLDQAAVYWRPVAVDVEHGILSAESIRFMAQDFVAGLQEHLAAPDRADQEGSDAGA